MPPGQTPAPTALVLHVTTLVLALRDGAILLVQRTRPPNVGLWSPPGGKIETGESPATSAAREFNEETGLTARDLRLAVIVSELDAPRHEMWLMFVYVATAEGEPTPSAEGHAAWVPLATLAELPRPPADAAIFKAALEQSGLTLLQVTFDNGRLTGTTAVSPPT